VESVTIGDFIFLSAQYAHAPARPPLQQQLTSSYENAGFIPGFAPCKKPALSCNSPRLV
jgi:hypothetical protein